MPNAQQGPQSGQPFSRVLLKVSGEALAGDQSFGIVPEFINEIARQITETAASGVQVAIVIGAGNIFRGLELAADGGDRVNADMMGMLGTVINSLALSDALHQQGQAARVLCAIDMPKVAELFSVRVANDALNNGEVVICAGGTGNPFFTTDTASALRAVELQCDILLKGTKVDGVYSADPMKVPDAVKFDTLTHAEVIAKDLRVMDTAAFALARDNNLPILVYALDAKEGLLGVLNGQVTGTRIG